MAVIHGGDHQRHGVVAAQLGLLKGSGHGDHLVQRAGIVKPQLVQPVLTDEEHFRAHVALDGEREAPHFAVEGDLRNGGFVQQRLVLVADVLVPGLGAVGDHTGVEQLLIGVVADRGEIGQVAAGDGGAPLGAGGIVVGGDPLVLQIDVQHILIGTDPAVLGHAALVGVALVELAGGVQASGGGHHDRFGRFLVLAALISERAGRAEDERQRQKKGK